MKLLTLICVLIFSVAGMAADIPGGLMRTSEGLPNNTYELILSPSYTFKPNGAYLSSEIRYQPNEDFGAGLGFGAGEIGFNIGVNGTWYILPDLANQPAFSVLGGIYLNRMQMANYFNVRLAPMISKAARMSWGNVTPYIAMHMTPSFRLGEPDNQFSLKAAAGVQIDARQLNGLKFFSEADVGLSNSVHEFVLGISYPFAELGG